MKNKTIDIDSLLDFIIGHTDIHCESNYDTDSKENLYCLEYVLYNIITRLSNNTEYLNNHQASAKLIATNSLKILKDACDNIKEIIEEVEPRG